jgi:hypothetical protein
MALILFVGSDLTVLEGLAQTLTAAGERVRLAESLRDSEIVTAADPPLIAVVERALAFEAAGSGAGMPNLTLAYGGTVVLYHGPDDAALPLPPALARITLADLTLPLERQRLVALVRTVADRARARGRDYLPPQPESRTPA